MHEGIELIRTDKENGSKVMGAVDYVRPVSRHEILHDAFSEDGAD